MATSTPSDRSARRRDLLLAAGCGFLAAGMVGMAYAAVPFYTWFCRTTGFGGTPVIADIAPEHALDRRIVVRFDANVAGGLPWRFVPEQGSVEVRIGEVVTVNYLAINESARETVGNASYNVSPPTVGAYFHKINCFCFTEQRLGPGEKRQMAVVFFVDPKLVQDSEQDTLNAITLSYTMYQVRQSEPQRLGSVGRKHDQDELTERLPMADVHAKPQHDYHLVDPSPWPIVGSVSAFVMAVGAIFWMHHMFAAAPYIFGLGLLGVAYTMIGWWRTVALEATYQGHHTRVVQISHRYGMILFIASEVMFFVAWFWAYFNTALFPADIHQVVRNALLGCGTTDVASCAAHGTWPPVAAANGTFTSTFDPWHLPLLNTLILLTSGTTVTWAHHALLENDRNGLRWGLILTIALGITFTCVQAYEYGHAAFSFAGHIYGSTFFMATGFHGAHVLIGTTFLIVCLIRAELGHFTPTQHLGFEFCAWYWHFVDVVWIFLFACIYVWGAGAHEMAAAAAGH